MHEALRSVVALVLVALCAVGPPLAASADWGGEPGEAATLRNATGEPIAYRIEAPSEIREIAPREVHRLEGDATIRIAVMQNGQWVSYPLEPGRPYSLRLNEAGAIEPFRGSHGAVGTPDLAPFVGTPSAVVEQMLRLAEVGEGDVLYDLGSGDGRIVIAAAALGASGVGIEINPDLVRVSREAARSNRVEDRVRFVTGDVLDTDLSPATVVTIYLLPESNELLREKLETELKPGSRIVSHQYDVPGWEAAHTAVVRDSTGAEHTLVLYVVQGDIQLD
jgi:precorrin-6B methylase 2